MSKYILITIVKNLALLAFVVMPLFFTFVWVQTLIAQIAEATDTGYVIETGLVYYLTNLLPVLFGGVAHQAIWITLPGDWSSRNRRVMAFLLTPLILLAVVVSWGGRW